MQQFLLKKNIGTLRSKVFEMISDEIELNEKAIFGRNEIEVNHKGFGLSGNIN